MSQRVDEYLARNEERNLQELLEFLRIPSVSTDPERKPDVRAAADFTRAKLAEAGLDAVVLETDGHPVVFAERIVGADLPTVLVYGHYDVQPAEPLELWDAPPFEPVVRNGVIYARGASDDKGQVYAHVKAAQALLDAEGRLPVNLKFLVEGEEEIGSPNLASFIDGNLERLAADVVVISDGAMAAPHTPTITYGLKGLAYFEIRVHGAAMDLHSGGFGGAVPNPLNALASMIAKLKSDDGRIAIPGFYDDVRELDDAEREILARAPFDEAEYRQELGITATPGEPGYSIIERLWARPTLDVNGIAGGFQGEGSKTVIANYGMAKVSCRLVPDQDPNDIRDKLERYLHEIAPEGVRVELLTHAGAFPALAPLDSDAVQSAARALREAHGRDVVFARTGGTIPVVSTFQRALGADVVLIGFGLESDRAHSPNERFDVENYRAGIRSSARVLQAFGGSAERA